MENLYLFICTVRRPQTQQTRVLRGFSKSCIGTRRVYRLGFAVYITLGGSGGDQRFTNQ